MCILLKMAFSPSRGKYKKGAGGYGYIVVLYCFLVCNLIIFIFVSPAGEVLFNVSAKLLYTQNPYGYAISNNGVPYIGVSGGISRNLLRQNKK